MNKYIISVRNTANGKYEKHSTCKTDKYIV